MRAKYTLGVCKKGCNVEGSWQIEVIRAGNKPNFIICSSCGNLIRKVDN